MKLQGNGFEQSTGILQACLPNTVSPSDEMQC